MSDEPPAHRESTRNCLWQHTIPRFAVRNASEACSRLVPRELCFLNIPDSSSQTVPERTDLFKWKQLPQACTFFFFETTLWLKIASAKDLLKKNMEEPTIHHLIFSQTLWKDCRGILLGECHGPTYRTRNHCSKAPHKLSLPALPWKSSTRNTDDAPSALNILSVILNHSAVFTPSWTPRLLLLLSAFLSFISPLLWQLTFLTFLLKHLLSSYSSNMGVPETGMWTRYHPLI